MARLFADEDFPSAVVVGLRQLGHDVETAQGAGMAGRGTADDVVLDCATADTRAVLSHNRRDFIRLHKKRDGRHSGIIVSTRDDDEAALTDRIHAEIGRCIVEHGELAGQLIRVNRGHRAPGG